MLQLTNADVGLDFGAKSANLHPKIEHFAGLTMTLSLASSNFMPTRSIPKTECSQ
jgi:hypothetical protein